MTGRARRERTVVTPPLVAQAVDLIARLYAKTNFDMHASLTRLDYTFSSDEIVVARALTEHPEAVVEFTLNLAKG